MFRISLLRLRQLARILRNKKLEWRRPAHSQILIFDKEASGALADELSDRDLSFMDTRMESLNLVALGKAVLQSLTSPKGKVHSNFSNLYIDCYINLVGPKLVVTSTDNNPQFYSLAQRNNRLFKTAFVQNGIRAVVGDVFQNLKANQDYFVDEMFVFSDSIGSEFKKYIGGKTITIGSLRNNRASIKDGPYPPSPANVLFISTWEPKHPEEYFTEDVSGAPITWGDYLAPESAFIIQLEQYCHSRGLRLVIAGRSRTEPDREHAFYRSLLTRVNYEFQPAHGRGTYALVDEADVVVTTGSTVGYEALARGAKVAIFTLGTERFRCYSYKFAWPAEVDARGPFWTDLSNDESINALLDQVFEFTPEEWTTIQNRWSDLVMVFDAGNNIFRQRIGELLSGQP
jgi:surface carbohydrate biosynthesis protein